MQLFDVYDYMSIQPVRAKGSEIWDVNGRRYLDFYGGHAVISIGHTHPLYVEALTEQLNKIGFYSNSVINPLQTELAQRLGKISGYGDYSLFLCNSGAEANENALKLASFATGREKILAFEKAFHGRTSAAVSITDNSNIQAPVNRNHKVTFIPLNDITALEMELSSGEYAAVIVEAIQGVGGIRLANNDFLSDMRRLCNKTGTMMIADEIQCGYGRSGKFFAHQYAVDVYPDIITIAKGMGNGFPIGGVLISPKIEARKGMLGTTFGGSYLACSAALAVLTVMENEALIENAQNVGNYLMEGLKIIEGGMDVRGRGLMIGVDTYMMQAEVRRQLLDKYGILTGYSGKNTLRLLPSLTISENYADELLCALNNIMS
ncbi:MAG: aminotransferase class III-fold pyridoxal phosphate-dependent enzyme [Culturomica sp.]|jgi:acetylornithine aminotransferase|nr:aminotransferase class III-fold pyridoxal phosphate-dependent enzyme [Culturomica sp.]